jgi:uncharacterized protein (TIGR02217 family)
MSFWETRFPDGISYGSLGGPKHNTAIVQVGSGAEERTARWSGTRLVYNAQNGVKTRQQMAEVVSFVRVMKGALHGFRWKDWSDFATDQSHIGLTATGPMDQYVATGDGVTKIFQLQKLYSRSGAGPPIARRIDKPVVGTITASLNGVTKVEGTDFSISYTGGLIVFNTAPPASQDIRWGGQFDVPVRFGKEADDLFGIRFDGHELRANDTIPVEEILNETPIDDEYNYRGGMTINPFNADIVLMPNDPLAIGIVPNSNSRLITLPNATLIPAGGIWFTIHNFSPTFTPTVQDHTAAIVATIAPATMATFVIIPDAAGTNQWVGY